MCVCVCVRACVRVYLRESRRAVSDRSELSFPPPHFFLLACDRHTTWRCVHAPPIAAPCAADRGCALGPTRGRSRRKRSGKALQACGDDGASFSCVMFPCFRKRVDHARRNGIHDWREAESITRPIAVLRVSRFAGAYRSQAWMAKGRIATSSQAAGPSTCGKSAL